MSAASCGIDPGAQIGAVQQAVLAPDVRFAELHYDNTGTDAGEAIEVSGPAGMDVTGWTVVLYNGNGGASYDTKTLTGAFPATCGTRGVMVINYAVNGIQNGSPDGMALVDAGGAVVEYLSYEGVFAATNGPANGQTSVDIGVAEAGNEPTGQSLQRNGAGTWSGPIAATFGACNDDGGGPPPPVVATVEVAPASATITVGGTQAFTATARDASGTAIPGVAFTWASSDTAVATVNATGVASGVAAGDATITATAPNSVSGSASLHVNAPQPGFPDTRFSEIHYDNTGTDVGEAIEIEGPAGTDVTGWSIWLYDGTGNQSYNTTALSGTIPATCGARGVIVVNYPTNGIQNGSPDGFALVDASGTLVEFLSYEGTFAGGNGPAAGVQSTDIVAQEASTAPVGQSLQRDGSNVWAQATSSFGACNPGGGGGGGGNRITFSGRVASDPALPVGFQAQLFATERDANNQVVTTTFTWVSDTPAIASVDEDGVFTGLAEGTAVLRATALDGTTGTTSLPVHVAIASGTASYAGNTEFGEPTDGDPSDDFIVRHAQFTSSYNVNRGTPNWVSYDLDASAFGPQDRCNCFTFDPALPPEFPRYTTADYTGSGAIAGFGIDRGHMVRSFDRTAGTLDNAFTFLFSNVVPQAADLNQGPWSDFEFELGDRARFENQEVYIITGVAGNRGTLKNEGRIVIPASTWKVAVIMPRDNGLADVHDYRDVEVIAVNMPNEPGIRNVPWQTYLTTVDAIEALTGYDLLALLPDKVENAVEANIKPPLGFVDGPYATAEGGAITASAAASLDPNGTIVSYLWDFGDGTTSSDAVATHTYVQDGEFTVRLTVTDNDGLTDTVFTTASVANVAPVVGAFAGATLLAGEAYSATGSFVDPGADPWTATVDYGDGTGTSAIALNGQTFALSHTYTRTGTFTVTVRVSDDDATAAATATVTVQSLAQATRDAIALVNALAAAGKINQAVAAVLRLELQIAAAAFDANRLAVAVVTLQIVVIEIDVLVQLGRLSAADAAPLRSLIVRTIRAANLQLGR